MSIWKHADSLRDDETVKQLADTKQCPHCKTPLTKLRENINREKPNDGGSLTGMAYNAKFCMLCGWWVINSTLVRSTSFDFNSDKLAAVASLKNLDLSDLSIPIEDIRSFLTAKYDELQHLHPRLLEQTVASVLVPEGFTSLVTGYTKDEGIDAIFYSPNGNETGIQVKQSKNKIGVEQIREFTGALVMRGITEGAFVTTSDYTRGAKKGAKEATKRGYTIELYNAERFYEALKLYQRRRYQDKEELIASIGTPNLRLIDSTHVLKPSEP